MALSYEEILKSDKDRELDKRFKNVRTAMKLGVAKFISEAGDGAFEKQLESFIGLDGEGKGNKCFLDDLIDISKLMEDTFNKLGDATEGALAHKLTSVSAIYMDRISQASRDAKINHFPMHKEKFAMDISEEQETKSIVPRVAIKSIKMYLDKYYFTFRQASVNAKARIIFVKFSEFRDKFLHFEWAIGDSLRRLDGQYIKEIAPFFKDTKLALLRLRKYFEAIEGSDFGKLVKVLQDVARETGTRMYLRYNATVTVATSEVRKGSVIPLKSILDKYDRFMAPIRATVGDYDNAKRAMLQRSPLSKDTSKMFWDISSVIIEFREGMHIVIDEFSKGVSPSDEDFKFFIHTVQTVIIPYMNQTKGEVNDSFVIGVKNLDTFFWKVTTKAVECGQEDGISMDEIIGIAVRLTKADIDKKPAHTAEDTTLDSNGE